MSITSRGVCGPDDAWPLGQHLGAWRHVTRPQLKTDCHTKSYEHDNPLTVAGAQDVGEQQLAQSLVDVLAVHLLLQLEQDAKACDQGR